MKKDSSTSTGTAIERLQHSLRLVHCLQKERGASASYYAYCVSHDNTGTITSNNGGSSSNNSSSSSHSDRQGTQRSNSGIGASLASANTVHTRGISRIVGQPHHDDTGSGGGGGGMISIYLKENLVQSRYGTDLAFDWLENIKGWKTSLDRVRNKIDEGCCHRFKHEKGKVIGEEEEVEMKNDGAATLRHDHSFFGSHRLVVMFNILIGNVVDECIIRQIHLELKTLRQTDRHDVDGNHKNCGKTNSAGGISIYTSISTCNESDNVRRRSTMSHYMARSLPLDMDQQVDCIDKSYTSTSTVQWKQNNIRLVHQSVDKQDNHGVDKSFHSNLEKKLVHKNNGNDADIKDDERSSDSNDDDHHSFQLPSHAATIKPLNRSHHHHSKSDFDFGQRHHHGTRPTCFSLVSCSVDDLDSNRVDEKDDNWQGGQRYWDSRDKLVVSPSSTSLALDNPLLASQSVPSQRRKNVCLLLLLLSLVNLKESTGTERAILSSLMALSPPQGDDEDDESQSESGHSSSLHNSSTLKLFNDLVVEEANQQRIARELQQLANKKGIDGNLFRMVHKMLLPSPEMKRVQDMIKDFNLRGLQHVMPLQEFWEMITLYIDQLHALELLLLDEIQLTGLDHSYFRNDKGAEDVVNATRLLNSQSYGQQVHTKRDILFTINPDWKELTTAELLEEIGSTDPNEIKQVFMNCIKMWKSSSNTSGSGSSSRRPSSISNSNEKAILEATAVPTPAAVYPNPILIADSESDHVVWKEWEIGLYEIEFCQRIGRGVGGTTYLAKWSGQQVAVKVSANTDLALDGWHTEVHSLRRLHHPNVIRLLGSIYNPSPQTYGLVLEYCNSGDMAKALLNPTPPNFFWKIAQDVANGMSYLHRKHILHRDIKPANVLLDGNISDGNFTAKLTDFGVAIMHQGAAGEEQEHTAETGTYRWMSPEVIRHEAYSFMADVYSYAILLWQLVTHEIPFQNMSQLEAAGKVAIENARPPFPRDTPDRIEALIQKCWSKNPNDRLTFANIIMELNKIHCALSDKEQEWLQSPVGHYVYNHQNAATTTTTTTTKNCRLPYSSPSAENKSLSGKCGNNIVDKSKSPKVSTESKSQLQQKQSHRSIFSFFHKNK